MDRSVEPREFELPLELQFSMKKAEIHAKDLTWDELYCALLNLYHQRLMEWSAIKTLLADEEVQLDFDVPTDLELVELATGFSMIDDEEDDDDGMQVA